MQCAGDQKNNVVNHVTVPDDFILLIKDMMYQKQMVQVAVRAYLIFVIFLHEQNFWRIKFTPKKRVNYGKIHSKLPNFCVISAKYTVNCQIFALNLKKITPDKKVYTNIFVGFVTNMRYE